MYIWQGKIKMPKNENDPTRRATFVWGQVGRTLSDLFACFLSPPFSAPATSASDFFPFEILAQRHRNFYPHLPLTVTTSAGSIPITK